MTKMTPQSDPKPLRFKKKSEIANVKKTTVFSMCLKVWGIRSQLIMQSKLINIRAWGPNMLLDTSNDIKYQKLTKNCPQ